MDIIIQSLGFNAGESLENFIREKVEAIKSDEIVRANVILYKGPSSNPESDYCEIRLEVPGNDHFVKRAGSYFETAVNECVELLNIKIQKAKDKAASRRQADAGAIHDAIIEADDSNTYIDLEDVVK